MCSRPYSRPFLAVALLVLRQSTPCVFTKMILRVVKGGVQRVDPTGVSVLSAGNGHNKTAWCRGHIWHVCPTSPGLMPTWTLFPSQAGAEPGLNSRWESLVLKGDHKLSSGGRRKGNGAIMLDASWGHGQKQRDVPRDLPDSLGNQERVWGSIRSRGGGGGGASSSLDPQW